MIKKAKKILKHKVSDTFKASMEKKKEENKYLLEQSEKNQKIALERYSVSLLDKIDKSSGEFKDVKFLNERNNKVMEFLKKEKFVELNKSGNISITQSGKKFLNVKNKEYSKDDDTVLMR